MDKIDLFLVNEHHEVFPIWAKKVKKDNLKDVTLVHVDFHPDLIFPEFLDISILKELDGIRSYTKKLTPGNFIIPSIFASNIKKILHVAPFHSEQPTLYRLLEKIFERKYIQFFIDGEKIIFKSRTSNILTNFGVLLENTFFYKRKIYSKSFILKKISPHRIPRLHKGVFLDIDLDYFAPNLTAFSLEISSKQYFELKKKFGGYFGNLFPFFKLTKKSGKFHFSFFPPEEKGDFFPNVNKVTIKRNISTICNIFEDKLKPELITICRSKYVRSTDPKYLSFIEKELVGHLTKIYDCNISNQ